MLSQQQLTQNEIIIISSFGVLVYSLNLANFTALSTLSSFFFPLNFILSLNASLEMFVLSVKKNTHKGLVFPLKRIFSQELGISMQSMC